MKVGAGSFSSHTQHAVDSTDHRLGSETVLSSSEGGGREGGKKEGRKEEGKEGRKQRKEGGNQQLLLVIFFSPCHTSQGTRCPSPG